MKLVLHFSNFKHLILFFLLLDDMFIIASLSPLWAHQPVQRATFCAPQDCVWRRVDAVMAWTTAMMRVMRFSAVSYYLKEQQIIA